MNHMRLGALLIALILVSTIASAEADTTNSYLKRYFVVLQDDADQDFLQQHGNIIHSFKIINAVAIELTQEAVEKLKLNPNVKTIEEDQIFYLPEEEESPQSQSPQSGLTTGLIPLNETTAQSIEEEQWNLGKAGINAQAAWETFGVQGERVKIAIIDTGINIDLPELAGRCLGSYSLEGDTADNFNHGTKLASAILADGPQVKGIAPKALYYNVKMTDDWSFWATDFRAAFEWTLLNTEADIIYTGPAISASDLSLESILTNEYVKGKLFVAQSYFITMVDGKSYPAHYATVIGIGGYENSQPPLLLTTNGVDVDVVAPGKDVPVIDNEDDITTKTGIDVAAAQVAGALTLMIDYNRVHEKGYSNSAIWETLNQSALDLWHSDSKAGFGKADVNAALTWLANDWFLEYHVNYLNPVTYDWDNNPVYWAGTPIQYTITVKNNSDRIINSKTITDLNVVSKQLYNGTEFFKAITLEQGEENEVTLGPYPIQPTQTGTYNTQVVLKKERLIEPYLVLPFTLKAIIKEDKSAGTFVVMNKPVPQGTCSDSDGGVDPWVFGTCTDSRGVTVSDQSLLANGSNEGGRVRNGAYVSEAFCLTEEMRLHCALENGIEYCYNLPNACYAASLLPSSGLAWTYFDRNDELYVCPNPPIGQGSRNGVCFPAVAGFKCKDELHFGYQNGRYQWSQEEYCNGKCTDGVCTKLSGTCLGTQAGQNRCIYFDEAHGGLSDWLQYCRVQYPTAPTGAWTNLKACPNGCLNGECIEGTAALSEGDAPIDSNALDENTVQQPDQNSMGENIVQPDENTVDENFVQPDENVSDGNIPDENALETNSTDPQLDASNTTETEPQPAPQQTATPPAQGNSNSGSGGGGGCYSANAKVVSNTGQSKESKVVESIAVEKTEKEETNAAMVTNAKQKQETEVEEKTEMQQTVLPVENTENPTTGFAALAQNALSAITIIVGGAIALFGKMLFR
jgi:hypothetical protein